MNEIATYSSQLRTAVKIKVDEAIERFFQINQHLTAQDVEVNLRKNGPYVRILIREKRHESQSRDA